MKNAPAQTDDGCLRQLIDAIIEKTATADELRELESLLRASAERRRYYRHVMGVHADLSWLHRAGVEAPDQAASPPAPGSLPAPVDSPTTDQPLTGDTLTGDAGPMGTLGSGIFLPFWSLAQRLGTARLAAAAAIVGLSLALGGTLAYRAAFLPADDVQDSAIAVAELRFDQHCVWGGLQGPIPVGAQLKSGQRLELTQGTAKLLFHEGATVLIESPAVFELLTTASMHLERGTVAVRAGSDKDFTVASPDASIVDLGTSFGVHRGERGATEVEVFEGAVEVHPGGQPRNSRVLGIGGSARVRHGGNKARVDMVGSAVDHFGDLLELLWEDMSKDAQDDADADESPVIVADFADGPVPGAVDTFYGAARGRGWRTPWVATGNPIGDIVEEEALAGEGNPYLRLRFGQANDRAIARQYGERPGFDPTKPHVISWRWRFDGNLEHFNDHFRDRVHFYGNPFFRRNSWPTNTWLLGVVGGSETQPSPLSNLPIRSAYPKRWYAFDGHEGKDGAEFDVRNMVDTGLELKAGIVYRFAVVVYPDKKKYDVAIRDDQQTFMRTGLSFRNRSGEQGNVVHFGAASDSNVDDFRFSLDSVRIEPLKEGWLPKDFSQSQPTSEPEPRPSGSGPDVTCRASAS